MPETHKELINESLFGEDKFSRILAQARLRLGYLGFENITNKELLLLSGCLRSLLPNKNIINRPKEAVSFCFFKIVGCYPDELEKNEKGEFTDVSVKYINRQREKFNQYDNPSNFKTIS